MKFGKKLTEKRGSGVTCAIFAMRLLPIGSAGGRCAMLPTALREGLRKSKPVIASAAKQSIFACASNTYGSPRRCAPGDDGLMQTFP